VFTVFGEDTRDIPTATVSTKRLARLSRDRPGAHPDRILLDLTKTAIELGLSSGPFHLTWSCYQREDVACGVCDSCTRLRGFNGRHSRSSPVCQPTDYRT
jgi:hypothetical protein